MDPQRVYFKWPVNGLLGRYGATEKDYVYNLVFPLYKNSGGESEITVWADRGFGARDIGTHLTRFTQNGDHGLTKGDEGLYGAFKGGGRVLKKSFRFNSLESGLPGGGFFGFTTTVEQGCGPMNIS